MMEFWILPNHAAMALGIPVVQLNLPNCGSNT